MRTTSYGLFVHSTRPFDQALEAVKQALKSEGFGILTDIDVKATMQEKLRVDFRQYEILGACNPLLAHEALEAEIDIGLLLPCNVIVYEKEDGSCTIGALDPQSMMSVTGNQQLTRVADDARSRLERVLTSLEN